MFFLSNETHELLEAPWPLDALERHAGEEVWVYPREAELLPAFRLEITRIWGGPRREQQLSIWIDGVRAYTQDVFYPGTPFPLQVSVEQRFISAPMIHEIHYEVDANGGEHAESEPIYLKIDHEAPNRGARGRPLVFDQRIIDEGVTQAYLDEHGEVVGQVPRWPDIALGDVVTAFWEPRPSYQEAELEDPAATLVIQPQHLIEGAQIEIAFTASLIVERGNGTIQAYYKLADEASNEGPLSEYQGLEVALVPPPIGLIRPRVPRAGDGLIDRDDACQGVFVEVDRYSNPLVGDEVMVWFNASLLASVPLVEPISFPVRVSVPWLVLSGYGESAAFDASVYYRVRRGGARPASDALGFRVDLRIPGPPNADPCPPNPLLEPVTVRGGGDRPLDNIIYPPDIGYSATAATQLYTNPVAGEILRLCWGDAGTEVARYRVEEGDSAGQRVTFVIPWRTLADTGSQERWPVYYRISNGVNEQQSPTTLLRIALSPGEVTVTGARSQTGPFYHANPALLVATSSWQGTLRWHYPGRNEVATGRQFLDRHPQLPLVVEEVLNDTVVNLSQLRPVNATGIASLDPSQSGCIVKDDGTVYGWGLPPPGNLAMVKCVVANAQAYAALHYDGTVTCWGSAGHGGVAPAGLTSVVQITAASAAFAALRGDGSLVTWGNPLRGGVIAPIIAPQLHDIQQVVGGDSAFAVLRADGEVFCWGGEQWPYGMTVVAARGSQRLIASDNAFAALTLQQRVIAWGLPSDGGSIPSELVGQLTGVVSVASTSGAFAAMTAQGRVLAWGNPRFGGSLPAAINNAQFIVGATTAFAVITDTQEVMTWGTAHEGGEMPGPLRASTVVAGYGSFAACRLDGSVVSWGFTAGEYLGNDARAVYAIGGNFMVLTANRQVVGWGHDGLDLQFLDGHVTHLM